MCLALYRIFHSSESGSRSTRTGSTAESDGGMKFKEITPHQDTGYQRNSRSQGTDNKQAHSYFFESGHETRTSRNPDDGNEHIQPDIIQYPK